MAYLHLGAEASTTEQLTGKEAGAVAGARLRYVGNQLAMLYSHLQAYAQLGQHQAEVATLQAKLDSLGRRIKAWEDQIVAKDPRSSALEVGLLAGLTGTVPVLFLYSVGMGIYRIASEAKAAVVGGPGVQSTLELEGAEWLNTVLAFEAEAQQLCKESAQLTGMNSPACMPLPAPAKPVPTSSTKGLLGGIEGLIKLGLIGGAIYFGGRALNTWLANRPVPASSRPSYLRGRVR